MHKLYRAIRAPIKTNLDWLPDLDDEKAIPPTFAKSHPAFLSVPRLASVPINSQLKEQVTPAKHTAETEMRRNTQRRYVRNGTKCDQERSRVHHPGRTAIYQTLLRSGLLKLKRSSSTCGGVLQLQITRGTRWDERTLWRAGGQESGHISSKTSIKMLHSCSQSGAGCAPGLRRLRGRSTAR